MENLLPFRPIASNSHRLLRRLREIMGGAAIPPPEKLDAIVKIIAEEMIADVCSVYILKAGIILELFATVGLLPQSVHKTRLKIGEGVVGDVAENSRPLILSDVKSHSNFRFFEGIGEENLQSFAGVPIFRSGRVLGVLVIQNTSKRFFTKEEIEILQTIAMILAEVIASGEIINPNVILAHDRIEALSLKIKGISLNAGLAKGKAVLYHPSVTVKVLISDDIKKELKRFERAKRKMQSSLKCLFSKSVIAAESEQADVLEAYQMFARDSGWLERIKKTIESGLTAEAAVQKVQSNLRFELNKSNDPYLRERLWDFEDLTDRMLHCLLGEESKIPTEIKEGIILIARSMGPAALLDYEKYNLQGLLLEEGLDTAHVSIVARALNIPVVSKIPRLFDRVELGDKVLVDGDNGQVVFHPSYTDLEEFEKKKRLRKQRQDQEYRIKDLPSVTKDGIYISMGLNAGLPMDLRHLEAFNVDSIGLYRTEIPFMMSSTFPDVVSQTRIYGDIIAGAHGKPIFFRTLDIGGDKILPYLREPEDENPVMGWRAIRIGLDRPTLLRQQVRSLLKASSGKELNIMYPMIADKREFFEAKELLDLEIKRLEEKRSPLPVKINLGVMVEVPSLAWHIEEILPFVDFISIGSNDLLQFFYAADRGNHHLIGRYDALSSPFLNLLKYIISKAKKARKPLTVCGEMAGNPVDAMVLLALGVKSLSMAVSSLGAVKLMIRSIDLKNTTKYINHLIKTNSYQLRNQLISFARDHSISI